MREDRIQRTGEETRKSPRKPSPPLWCPAFGPIQQPLPGLRLCTQVICDNQRALEGLESIAHQVNKVFHDPEQVHRARRHLGTERYKGPRWGEPWGKKPSSPAPHLLSVIPLVLVLCIYHEAHHLEEALGREQRVLDGPDPRDSRFPTTATPATTSPHWQTRL